MQPVYELGGYREYAPPADLRSIVESSWTYVRPDAGEVAHRVLPDLNVTINFESSMGLIFIGPMDHARIFRPGSGERIEAVRFNAEWCRPLLGVDPAEHHNAIRPLADIIPGLAKRLLASRDIIEGILKMLRERHEAARHERDIRLAHSALEIIRNRSARVASIARSLSISERHLRRAIVATTGNAPKIVQRTRRLNRAVIDADRVANPDWATIALNAGFYDQAHFIQDVRAMTGQTPTELHAERRAQTVA
jgi:AraC-like DNA-binding protein